MGTKEAILTILTIAATTWAIRVLPFLAFPAGKKPPALIAYLGAALPSAVIAMLVIYCFKSVSVMSYPYALPEIIAAAFVALAHKIKRNMLLSIGGGTILYMILVQAVFK